MRGSCTEAYARLRGGIVQRGRSLESAWGVPIVIEEVLSYTCFGIRPALCDAGKAKRKTGARRGELGDQKVPRRRTELN